jgi:DNA-directed RNA polymerase subunit L
MSKKRELDELDMSAEDYEHTIANLLNRTTANNNNNTQVRLQKALFA